MRLVPTTDHRILNLDLLRATAIVLVVGFHVTQMLTGDLIEDRALFTLGKYGVNLFFVLSGFLVGGMYFRQEPASPVIFWLKRLWRTYPPYLIIVFLSWAGVYLSRDQEFNLGYLVMVQNYYDKIPFFLVSWSLNVEEHFYLVFLIVILFVKNPRKQLLFWIFFALIPILIRMAFRDRFASDFGYHHTATYFHIDSLSFGVLAAYLVHKKGIRLSPPSFSAPFLFLLFIACAYHLSRFNTPVNSYLGPTILNLIITALLLVLYFNQTFQLSYLPFIKLNALMAYSIYLTHPIMIHLCMAILRKLRISHLALSVPLTLIVLYAAAFIFYRLVEKPVIEYRNLLFKK